MANEAVIIELNNNNPVRFTVASGSAIAKGTICKLSDPRTAAASSADSDVFAGIAAAGKSATDYATNLALHIPGQGNIFDLTAAATTITAGQLVSISGANLIKTATEAEVVTGDVIGKALETAAVSEVIAVLV